jgi:hypothetical protein
MNPCAITHSSHLRIASGAATLFALPVCWFLIPPRSVREVPLPPTRTSAKLLTLPRKRTVTHLGNSLKLFPCSTNPLLQQILSLFFFFFFFFFFAKPYDQQPLRSSFVTASRRRLSRCMGDGREITPAPTSHTDRHSPNYSPARSTETDRLLPSSLPRCSGAREE